MKRIAFFILSLARFAAHAQELSDTAELAPVEVRAIRAGHKAPFTKTNLDKASIEKANIGVDLPFLLNQTPSVIVSSDAGNGVGYTGLRIRGTDLTRINVTLNGVPYNDAESGNVYFVDLPDFASSVSSLQVQRGVGTSSNGGGAFGGTINLSTNEINEQPYAAFNSSFGSFNTQRYTVKLGTGLLQKHFTIDARLSKISTDGFVDRAFSNLQSYYISTAWLNSKSSLRLNVFSGKEKTFQAWSGVPEFKWHYDAEGLQTHYFNNIGSYYFTQADSVNLFTADPKKYNVYLYPNQTDNYRQDHYQLFFNYNFPSRITLSTALFFTHGEGYYEEYKYNQKYIDYNLADYSLRDTLIRSTDLIRQLWLKNNLFGGTFSIQHTGIQWDYTLGGSWNRFEGAHFGKVIWAQQGVSNDYEWYHYPATKNDGNIYGKLGYKATSKLYLLADFQYRGVKHSINGTRKFPSLIESNTYTFFNPKLGVNYTLEHFTLYVSYAQAHREPNRTDFETSRDMQAPRPEKLHDFEAGIEHTSTSSRYGINAYYMHYKDQLVLTGKLNDVGDAIRINVPHSYRLGVEAWAGLQLTKIMRIDGNVTISQNKIKNYTDYIPMYDADFGFTGYDTLQLTHSEISFSPWFTAFASVSIKPVKNLECVLNSKTVSQQYLDNTKNNSKRLDGYFVQDLLVRYSFKNKFIKEGSLFFQLTNVWNTNYASNGYTFSYFYDQSLIRENFYFPMAGRNVMLGVNVRL